MQHADETVRVWDPFVRVFHWSLVLAFAVEWATAEGWMALHERAGYFILVLLGLRIAWGLIGTRHARFRDFVRGRAITLAYLRSLVGGAPQRYLGHNPAGGWMVIALILALIGTVATGLMMQGDGGLWEELHEGMANLTLLLVLVHVSGVVVASLLHHENLVGAMLSGRKKARIDHG